MKNRILTFLTLIFITGTVMVNGQNVHIPDVNFKAALVGDTLINTNGDDEIQVDEALTVTALQLVNLQIADLTGIEEFTNLEYLNVSGNPLTSIDLSRNVALIELDVSNSQLAVLDVSQNMALTVLKCGGNPLGSLDVSQNIALTLLDCMLNQLTTLDLSRNTALVELSCPFNRLTGIDLSHNTALTHVWFDFNHLTALDVSHNTVLVELRCYFNQLTTINLSNLSALEILTVSANRLTSLDVSHSTMLRELLCSGNRLTNIDVSNLSVLKHFDISYNALTELDVTVNTALTSLNCMRNQLLFLNVANGNNANFTRMIANSNPDLTCILVDDEAYSTANWTTSAFQIDSVARFSEDCLPVAPVSMQEFFWKTDIDLYPNPAAGFVTLGNLPSGTAVSIIDAMGRIVYHTTLANEEVIISTGEFSAGAYHVRMEYKGAVAFRKLIVSKH